MKTQLYKPVLTGLVVMFLASACISDLDPKSLGQNSLNSATVYQTTADYKSGLAKVYAAFSLSGQQGPAGNPDIINVDEGFATYLREYWNVQELPTDEAVYSWAEDGQHPPASLPDLESDKYFHVDDVHQDHARGNVC
ncbi:MAG: hypothetical protein WDO15_06445 [Bacteroidota bacterium]